MQPSGHAGKVAVIGGGLGGAMMAIYLARRGFQVRLFEQRPDLRLQETAIASMNLGLSRRGLESLARVGLEEEVCKLAIPMHGRVIHGLDGRLTAQPYGQREGEVIHAIGRSDINRVLLEAAAACDGIKLAFKSPCRLLDKEKGEVQILNGEPAARETFDFIVAADGVSSSIRRQMQSSGRADYSQESLPWGWKEIRIPPGPDGAHVFTRNAFHLWPRGGSLLFAHPNLDASFTCSLVLPYEGPISLSTLCEEAEVRSFFADSFPDLIPVIPDLAEQFLANPIIHLVTVRTSPWYWRDKVVLLGDAAHAVVPFLAQGMNAAFEDCAVLDQALADHPGHRAGAFAAYQANRLRHTDALATMSKRNFVELRDTVRSPWVRLRKRIDFLLHRLLGSGWMPLHARVTNTSMPYAEALARESLQSRILVGVTIAAVTLGVLALWLGLR